MIENSNLLGEVKAWLKKNPTWLKQSPFTLAHKLKLTPKRVNVDICKIALSEVRQETKKVSTSIKRKDTTSSTKTIAIKPDLSGLKLKSRWQNASGEWLESYVTNTTTEETNFLNDFKQEFFKELRTISGRKKLVVAKSDKPVHKETIALEISLPDLHFGKGDVVELYNLAISSTINLVNQAAAVYNIEKIILPIGNDGLNSEGLSGKTTKGTLLEREDVSWNDSFKYYWNFLIQQIDILLEHAPVEVIVVQGNHDFERMFYIGEVLVSRYENTPNVFVENSVEPNKYVKYGECLIGYNHGDKIKPADLPLVMATEVPEEWASTKHREWHLGHFHHEKSLDEFRAVKVRLLPSICKQDLWHKSNGFDAYRTAQAFCWNKNNGLISILQKNV